MDFDDLGATACQDAREPADAVAPHGIHDDGQAGGLDRLHVNQVSQMGEVGRRRIETLHQTLSLGLVQRQALYLRDGGDVGLDFFQPVGSNRAAVLVPHLEAVIGGWVVAGGDVDCARRSQRHHSMADDRGGGGSLGEVDMDVVGGQHLGHRRGEVLRGEAAVVAHHHALFSHPLIKQITSKALGTAPDVVESVILSDLTSPAVGTEFDFHVSHKPFLTIARTLEAKAIAPVASSSS